MTSADYRQLMIDVKKHEKIFMRRFIKKPNALLHSMRVVRFLDEIKLLVKYHWKTSAEQLWTIEEKKIPVTDIITWMENIVLYKFLEGEA